MKLLAEHVVLTAQDMHAQYSTPIVLNGEGYIVAEMTVNAPGRVVVDCHLPDGDHCLVINYTVASACRVRVPFPVDSCALRAGYFFIPPRAGVFKGQLMGTAVDAEKVNNLQLRFKGKGLESVEIHRLYWSATLPDCSIEAQPLLDEMGQRIRGEWKGKMHSVEEMTESLRKTYAEAKENNGFPEGWSRWGGWLKKRFEPTGWFYVTKADDRWWLVDPDGYAYFSNAMCYGNRKGIFGFVEGMESLHEWLPPKDGVFADAWTDTDQIPLYPERYGHDPQKKRLLVNFPRANMIRAFGDQWEEAWETITAARLKRMGFNSIGVGINDYSCEHTREFLEHTGLPYVITLKGFPRTEKEIFRDFPDVFSDEYAQKTVAFAQRELSPWSHDPAMIGYFVTNEPEWLFYEGVNLTERMLSRSEDLSSKHAFVRRMKEKYQTVEKFRDAWGLDSFEALFLPAPDRDKLSAAAEADCQAFHTEMVELYGRIVSDSLRKAAPYHLNLGMRYASMSDKAIGGDLSFYDIFSYNCYRDEPATDARHLAAAADKPMMVGEWHIGAQESGLDAWGIRLTKTQAERAQACTYYMEQSVANPNLVGVHYFEYGDQPYLGRFDGECYQIGLVDVCGTLYPETEKAFMDFAAKLYPMMAGEETGTTQPISTKTIGEL